MMYLFTLIYDVLVYSQIIHSTNLNRTRVISVPLSIMLMYLNPNPNLNPNPDLDPNPNPNRCNHEINQDLLWLP